MADEREEHESRLHESFDSLYERDQVKGRIDEAGRDAVERLRAAAAARDGVALREGLKSLRDEHGWLYRELAAWDEVGYGLDFAPAKAMTLNNIYVRWLEAADLLYGGTAACPWDKVIFDRRNKTTRSGEATWPMQRPATVYGLALWWRAELTPDEKGRHGLHSYGATASPAIPQVPCEGRVAFSDSRQGATHSSASASRSSTPRRPLGAGADVAALRNVSRERFASRRSPPKTRTHSTAMRSGHFTRISNRHFHSCIRAFGERLWEGTASFTPGLELTRPRIRLCSSVTRMSCRSSRPPRTTGHTAPLMDESPTDSSGAVAPSTTNRLSSAPSKPSRCSWPMVSVRLGRYCLPTDTMKRSAEWLAPAKSLDC